MSIHLEFVWRTKTMFTPNLNLSHSHSHSLNLKNLWSNSHQWINNKSQLSRNSKYPINHMLIWSLTKPSKLLEKFYLSHAWKFCLMYLSSLRFCLMIFGTTSFTKFCIHNLCFFSLKKLTLSTISDWTHGS